MRNCNFLRIACRAVPLGLLFYASPSVEAETFSNLAGEYAIVGNLPGDQMGSHVELSANGGWVVWHDNATDGSGLGISARRLNSSLSGEFNTFRINQIGLGEQENPKVSLLQNGGAAFVWQGGQVGFQNIYLRIIGSEGVFQTGDVLVNTYTNQQQGQPVITTLNNGNLAVAWSSYGQDGSMQGVYARIFSDTGTPITSEFLVNQRTSYNQRNPQVAALADGRILLAWASERPRSLSETNHFVPQHVVEVVGRVFNAEGVALSDEFLLSAADSVCAQPMVAAVPAGGFVAAWSQLDGVNSTNSWDIYVRSFAANQQPLSAPVRVNNFLPGDQYGPKLAVYSNNVLAVWTSMGQDGSYEGVYGRFLTAAGALSGSEFRVNSTTVHKQINPSVASDGNSRFLVVWSSFIGGPSSFDLFAQRYVSSTGLNLLYAPDAPFVTALGSAAISATWPELAGYSVAFYELHVSGLTAPVVVSNIHATVTGLLPATTYSARLLYELTDGRRSALSSPAYVKTWGQDLNGDGLPDDWQTLIWGENPANWPDPMADSDGDGASNFAEFLAGTNPLSAASVLKTRLHRGPEGFRFSWNTTPGFVYQVQSGVGLDSWQNVGSPRFAHATFDSIQITPGSGAAFYRVIRLR